MQFKLYNWEMSSGTLTESSTNSEKLIMVENKMFIGVTKLVKLESGGVNESICF